MSDSLIRVQNELIKIENQGISEQNKLSNEDYFEIKSCLRTLISNLLDSDLQGLLSLLYRVAVSEQKVKTILVTANAGEIAEQIAALIIERQIQKIITRRKYK
jgi:hypothetical protein